MLELGSIFLNKYAIGTVVGKGGMGSVYSATYNGSLFAIKEELLTDNNKFLLTSEINILSSLNHPGIPRVYECVQVDEYIYIVMDFIQGITLEKLLAEKGKIPEGQVIRWMLEITDILIYLHGRSTPVVYRDLKPANIIITPGGEVRIIDFGIAQEYTGDRPISRKAMALTRGYAAPEQYNGQFMADVRTDIYALGVTCHYMLTGKNPNKPPFTFRLVRKYDSSLSLGIEHIIRKCIDPNPDNRYESGQSLKSELTNIEKLNTSLKKKKLIKTTLLGVLVLVIALVAAIVTLISFGKRQSTIGEYNQTIENFNDAYRTEDYNLAIAMAEEAIMLAPEEATGYVCMAYVINAKDGNEACMEFIRAEIVDRFPDIYDNDEFMSLMSEMK